MKSNIRHSKTAPNSWSALAVALTFMFFSVFTNSPSASAASSTMWCSASPTTVITVTHTLSGTPTNGQTVTIQNLTFSSTPPISFDSSRIDFSVAGATPSSFYVTGGPGTANQLSTTNYGNFNFSVTGSAGSKFSITVTAFNSYVSGVALGCPGLGGTVAGTPKFVNQTIAAANTATTTSVTATSGSSASASTSASGNIASSSQTSTTVAGDTTTTGSSNPASATADDQTAISQLEGIANNSTTISSKKVSLSKKTSHSTVIWIAVIAVLVIAGIAFIEFKFKRTLLRSLYRKFKN